MKRQDVLAAAWKDMSAKDVADEDYAETWMKIRAAALEAEGLPVVFN
jgi:hypothetical protein